MTPTEKNDVDDSQILTRAEIIKEFHSDQAPYRVIIANPFAVGESISLHKACHNAIYLENHLRIKDVQLSYLDWLPSLVLHSIS